jgi:S1-C subfamily serine protease
VVRVDAAGPAEAAGIKVGDGGKELADAVRLKQPGSTVRVRVRRHDGDRELRVVLAKRPKG